MDLRRRKELNRPDFQEIEILINSADLVYQKSLQLLSKIRNLQPMSAPSELLSFQIDLSKSLFKQETKIVEISRIINKSRKNIDIQLEQMRELLRETVEIGKSIGDAFVWSFYVSDLPVLEQHQRSDGHGPSPGGLGIRGEVAFLENFQGEDGYLYLYHGITNFLRLGDFSVFDPKSGHIVAIVELKTIEYVNNQLRQEIHTVFTAHEDLSRRYIASLRSKSTETLPPPSKTPSADATARKERQLRKIEGAIRDAKGGEHIRIDLSDAADTFGHLEKCLLESCDVPVICQKLNSHMGIVAMRMAGSSLLETLEYKAKLIPDFGKMELEELAKSIIDPAWTNEIRVSKAFYGDKKPIVFPGFKPFYWCFKSEQVAHDVLMKRVIVTNLFNGGELFHALTEIGWSYDSENATFHRKNGKEQHELGNIEFFLHVANWYYYDTSTILNQIEQTVEAARTKSRAGSPVRAELHIRHE